MSKYGSTQELHARIGEKLEKLKTGKLAIHEFEGLLDESRELYERLLILRYKAFENYVSGNQLPVSVEVEAKGELPESIHEGADEASCQSNINVLDIPHHAEQVIVDNNEPTIEFALFGESSLDESPSFSRASDIEKTDEKPVHKDEDIREFPIEQPVSPIIAESKPEIAITSTRVEVRVEEHKFQSKGSLLDQLSTGPQSNRLADQLKKSRIESIASTLTLNDRIRFSKNLFNGNSETFNAAVQLFDAQKSMMESMEVLREYSERFRWDQDDKTTMDFYELVERRHA